MSINNIVEDQLLVEFIDKSVDVNIFLLTGIKLTGIIKSMDDVVIVLKNSSKNHSEGYQIIYKQSISTIAPINSNDVDVKSFDNK